MRSSPHRGYREFRKAIKARSPEHYSYWTEHQYADLMSSLTIRLVGHDMADGPPPWMCNYCRCPVQRWGGVYWVDRVNNAVGYAPGNCVPACSGCNMTKFTMHPACWDLLLDTLVRKYGYGSVPWDSYGDFRRVDENQYPALPESQMSLLDTTGSGPAKRSRRATGATP